MRAGTNEFKQWFFGWFNNYNDINNKNKTRERMNEWGKNRTSNNQKKGEKKTINNQSRRIGSRSITASIQQVHGINRISNKL